MLGHAKKSKTNYEIEKKLWKGNHITWVSFWEKTYLRCEYICFSCCLLFVQKLVSTISNLSEYFLLNVILKNELSQKDKKENSLWKLQRNEIMKKIMSFCPSITHTKNTHKH